MNQSDWESEKAFWASPNRPETFDFEDVTCGYSSHAEMVKVYRTEYYFGDWVRSEDYRRDVERLERLLEERKAF